MNMNFIVYKISGLILGDDLYLVSNAIAWFAAIVFSYVTNKLYVFKSKSWKTKVILKEISSFFGARIFTFVIEETGLFALVDIVGFGKYSIDIMSFNIKGDIIAKLIIAVVVVVINYLFSKLFIFKKKA